ncbi:hypothetical protein GCM10018962_93060 [Dactylosporangium matsuzakiense]|uniref:Uncharacterized protein n=1 Tax=Dactylosporangium matsuzakiense TaxID=53360 RepID=A0A9W6KMG2_9ACTN|nr:hypothetical protein GCM10017581_037610 [Dactylosporangium matsuzakiense]
MPEPFGPTTQVMPGSSFSVVVDAKDLKPLAVRVLRCTDLHGVEVCTGQATAGTLPFPAVPHTIMRVSLTQRPLRPHQ